MRAWVWDGYLSHPDSVRVDEYVNYFDGGSDSGRVEEIEVEPSPATGQRSTCLAERSRLARGEGSNL
jgi:hypothetical protein